MVSNAGLILDIRKIRSAHIKCRSFAYAAIDGADVPAHRVSADYQQCVLGRWYYGAAQQTYSEFRSFAEIAEPHKQFHKIYGDMVRLMAAGNTGELTEQKEQLTEASRRLLAALDALEDEIAGG